MTAFTTGFHILTIIITIGATAVGILYLIKWLISTNRKDLIKFFVFIGIVILVNLLEFYFIF